MVLFVGIKTYSYKEKRGRKIGLFIMDDIKFIIYVYKKWLLYLTVTTTIVHQTRAKETGKSSICPAVHSWANLSKSRRNLMVLSEIFQEAVVKACIDISFDSCLISNKLLVKCCFVSSCYRLSGRKQAYFSKSRSGTVYL